MTDGSHARQRFLQEYRQIRRAEGRGSTDSQYYEVLPFNDLSGRSVDMWAMRAKTFLYFERNILEPLEQRYRRPLTILDLGAGNCRLSHQLCRRSHRPVAVDIFNDKLDGLGAASHYSVSVMTVEADFDELPIPSSSFDLVVYNSSFHYSGDYVRTLLEAKRCLRPDGQVVILDSPIYNKKEDGHRMLHERRAYFEQRYGFRSDSLQSIEFLDLSSLQSLSATLHMQWHVFRPWYGWRWHLRPFRAWLRRQRAPSRFWILTGTFDRS